MTRATGLLAVLGLAGAVALPAQSADSARWTMHGSQRGYCIWYLVDTATALSLVPHGVTVAVLSGVPNAPAALLRVAQDEPRFAGWVPAAFCLHFYDSVALDDRTIATEGRGREIVIATSSIAAADPFGTHAGHYLLSLMSNDRQVRNAAGDLNLGPDDITMTSRDRGEGGDSDITFESGGVRIIWTGHPTGTPDVGTTQAMSFGYAGSHRVNWAIAIQDQPANQRYMVGSLEVDGKNTLAKALKASPIRAVGPEWFGGSAEMTFHKSTKP